MVICWALECKHYNQRDPCKFFRFPNDTKERTKWKTLAKRTEEPGTGAFLCSCHFPNGQRQNGPHLLHNVKNLFTVTSPERKAKKIKLVIANDEIKPTAGPTTSYEDIHKYIDISKNIPDDMSKDIPDVKPKVEVGYDENIYADPLDIAKDIPEEKPEIKNITFIIADDAIKPTAGPSTSYEDIPEVIPKVELECNEINFNHQPSTSTSKARDNSSLSIAILEAENYFLKRKVEELESRKRSAFSYEDIGYSDRLVCSYTGLPNAGMFESLYQLFEHIDISNYYLQWNVAKIAKKDQLLLCLMKLRQNFPHEDLALRYAVSQATVTNILVTWIHVLHEILYKQRTSTIPIRNKNNCKIILDCTEIVPMVPKSSTKTIYSVFKYRNAWKALIGVSPNGVVKFISDLYPGSTPDKNVVEDSKILEQLHAGDLILPDKRFLLKDILPPQQLYQRETIANGRILVERAVKRIKCYKILDFMPQGLQNHASCIAQVIGALTNLRPPLFGNWKKPTLSS